MKKNDLRGKTILVVNTGSPKKKFTLQKLKKLGITIVLIHFEKNWASPYVDYWITSDLSNHKESLQKIKNFQSDNPHVNIEGVLTFWEESVLLTSKIVDMYGFTGIPFPIAQHTKNKYLFREYCRKQGLKTPKNVLIRKKDDLQRVSENLDFPIVLKPVYGAASAFVIKVEEESELMQTYEYIKQNITGHPESVEWDTLDIYAEDYIDGDEVDIDIILQNGKIKFHSITDNSKTSEPFFVETGQSIPTTLPRNSQKALIDMAEETLEKLGIQNGIIHFEAKINNMEPVPIEINMRMGGDEVYSFVKGAWGVDMIEYAAKIAFGMYVKRIEKPDIPKKFITGTYFLSNYSGILVKLSINKNLLKKRYVEEFHFYKKIGDTVLVPPEGYEYLGWITTSGENPIDAQDNLELAQKYIHYTIAKFDPSSMIGRTTQKNRFSSAYLTKKMIKGAVRIEQIKRISRKNLQRLHIGIVDHKSNGEKNRLRTILKEQGYTVSTFNFNELSKAIFDLKESDVSLVINPQEKLSDSHLSQHYIACILDMLQIPHTSSNEMTLNICEDKTTMKKLLQFHDIPIIKWDYLDSLDEELDSNLKLPLSIATRFGGKNYIANNNKELQKKIKEIIEKGRKQVLIEEYFDGDEYEVFIIGNDETDLRALPLTRFVYSPHNKPQIQRPPKNINKKVGSLITEIALDAYYVLGAHDYGMARIKVDSNNNPYLIDFEPQPSLAMDGNFAQTGAVAGFNYTELIEEIISVAIKRYKNNFEHTFLQLNI